MYTVHIVLVSHRDERKKTDRNCLVYIARIGDLNCRIIMIFGSEVYKIFPILHEPREIFHAIDRKPNCCRCISTRVNSPSNIGLYALPFLLFFYHDCPDKNSEDHRRVRITMNVINQTYVVRPRAKALRFFNENTKEADTQLRYVWLYVFCAQAFHCRRPIERLMFVFCTLLMNLTVRLFTFPQTQLMFGTSMINANTVALDNTTVYKSARNSKIIILINFQHSKMPIISSHKSVSADEL